MMQIAVISDTHSRPIPDQVLKGMKKADLVIHAGDICDVHMLKEIEKVNDVEAVCGNMDESELREKLSRRMILKCEDINIGIFHGEGAPEGLINRVENEFRNEHLDVIIFGHSHAPFNKKIGGVLFLNPGSPNDDIFSPYCSYGLLKIEGNSVKSEIIKVE